MTRVGERGNSHGAQTHGGTDDSGAYYRNAPVLTGMITDMLDASRGNVRIEMQLADVEDVLRSALESVRATPEAKNIDIVTDFERICSPVCGDPARLRQVFWNLLSNAVKFTPPGGRIRVAARSIAGRVHVEITDTGVGITPDFLPHVFERFTQRDDPRTGSPSGFGLGLAIVRHLVELHHGTVKAESAGEGQGATFTVTLPVCGS